MSLKNSCQTHISNQQKLTLVLILRVEKTFLKAQPSGFYWKVGLNPVIKRPNFGAFMSFNY